MVRALRRRFDDDEDESDYDPKYPGKRVFRDGRGPRVPLYMTDSASRRFVPLMDARARAHQATIDSYRLTDRQAAAHRPHEATASFSDRDIRNARSRSEHARAEWIRRMQDAWSHPMGGLPRTPPNGNGDGPDDDQDENGDNDNGDDRTEAERARDEMIEQASRAWSQPWRGVASGPSPSDVYASGGNPAAAANAVEAQRRRWTRESPTDAALTDKDAAYGEYCQRICNAWKG
jgi:hypothetical protein